MEMRVGSECVKDYRFLTYFDTKTDRVKETYLLSAFAAADELSPVTWRHIMYQYDGTTGGLKFFLDGNLVMDSMEQRPLYAVGYHGSCIDQVDGNCKLSKPLMKVSDIFSNMTVVPHSWSSEYSGYGPYATIPGKMAQMRVYPWKLSSQEVLTLHGSSLWPSGIQLKQCINPATDEDYFDTTQLDARRQSCAWYYRIQLRYPYICRLKWLKVMCPVLCSSKRLCHDGKLNVGYVEPEKPKSYWLFDRIQYLKPKKEGQTVLCRAKKLDVAEVMQTCEDVARMVQYGNSTLSSAEEGAVFQYQKMLLSLFTGVVRFDARNCSALREMLEEDPPCTFDNSWMPDFAKQFNRTKTWSLTFWLRPKPGSYGMPSNFWFAAKFFSKLSPPILLNHWHEIQPKLEVKLRS